MMFVRQEIRRARSVSSLEISAHALIDIRYKRDASETKNS